ncbi:MAG TPA: hypothetical protein VEI50_00165 [Nitrospiraceae bacterium]|nr:hypothetical protein [Nitrospiraceae bacterium]
MDPTTIRGGDVLFIENVENYVKGKIQNNGSAGFVLARKTSAAITEEVAQMSVHRP